MNANESKKRTSSKGQDSQALAKAIKKIADQTEEIRQLNQQLELIKNGLVQQIWDEAQTLRRNEQEHRLIIESIQDVIYKISPADGTFTFVSPVIEKIVGYTEQELLGQPYTILITPEHQDYLRDFYLNMVRIKTDNTYQELIVQRKDGSEVWIGQTVRVVTNEDGTRELVAVARDISARKAAEEALRSTQMRLKTLITNSHSAVLVEDENHAIVLMNQEFRELFGLEDEVPALSKSTCSVVFRLVAHLFEEPEKFLRRIDELLTNQQIVITEDVCMMDGRRFERDYIPVWHDDQYMGHLWRYTDVTEKYQAREQLRKSEEKYRGIMNNMELGLLEVDNHQTVIRAYDRFCQMLGYSPEELVGQSAVSLLQNKEAEALVNQHQLIREQGRSTSYELPLLHKNGQTVWMLVSGAPILDEQGTVVGSIGIHYNLTERKQLEMELEQARQIAEESRLAEKQFLANMSHEIRTPLNAIIGMTHLLYDTRPSQQQVEYMDIIRTSADFLHSLISDLLDMAKIEAGRIEVNRQPFDLAGQLRSLQKVFRMRLQNRPIDMDVMLDADITGKYIGDDLMLNQILLNLVGNAEKFTEEGSIMLTARVRRKEEEQVWIEFQVSDTGIGIPADKQDRVFQKFRQISPEGHKHKGTGLGLAITKELIELQGGTISVRSEVGRGTTFTFGLPYTPALVDEQISIVTPSKETAGQVENLSILVAEDNLMNQKYVSGLLKKWQVTFVMVNDGQQAVDMCHKQKFDLILMDVQMPVMNGYEATIAIRTIDNPNQNIPIVALTASAMLDHKEMAYKAGMNDFLTKPFAPDVLLTTLKRYASQMQAAADSTINSVSLPPLDDNRLTELYDDDAEYAASIFEMFIESVLPEFNAFDELIEQQQWEEVKRLAHRLRPSLSMVGLTDLLDDVRRLEELAAQEPVPDIIKQTWLTFQADLTNRRPLLDAKWQDYVKKSSV